MGSGETATSPFPCSAQALTPMLVGCSAPQSTVQGLPSRVSQHCSGATHHCWCQAACAQLLQKELPVEADRQYWVPIDFGSMCTRDGCSLGSRALGRNRKDVLLLHSGLQMLEFSLSGNKGHLRCKEANLTGSNLQKWLSFPDTLKALLSPHLLLTSDRQYVSLELPRVWSWKLLP